MSKRTKWQRWSVTRMSPGIQIMIRYSTGGFCATPVFHCQQIYPRFLRMTEGTMVLIRRPIITFLDRPTETCWWLSCDSVDACRTYSIRIAQPRWSVDGWRGGDATEVAMMCPDEFEAVYPKAKLRARTCKPIAPIKLVRI